ncbi:MAG TPA: helix-turn-helix domain-containing protein [Ferruginibacter sp.]|nr:helix-turn-helix domain-containing protein [Ferruginibacter sp.]HMP20933.1 helix-turn-helix domain-containing protein [Ferruginibacter sp.]
MQPVNMPVAKRIIANTEAILSLLYKANVSISLKFDSAELNHESISEMICKGFEISRKSLEGKRRDKVLVTARMLYYYLMRLHTKCSLEQIGMYVNRHHTTVMAGIRQATNLMQVQDEYLMKYATPIFDHINTIYDLKAIQTQIAAPDA